MTAHTHTHTHEGYTPKSTWLDLNLEVTEREEDWIWYWLSHLLRFSHFLARHNMKFQSRISQIKANIFSMTVSDCVCVCVCGVPRLTLSSSSAPCRHIWIHTEVIIQFSKHWSLISARCSRKKPLPYEVMSLIPLKPFWLNQKLDSISAYPLPNKPTEPHSTEMHSFLHTAHIWELRFAFFLLACPHFAPDLSKQEGGESHLHREERFTDRGD